MSEEGYFDKIRDIRVFVLSEEDPDSIDDDAREEYLTKILPIKQKALFILLVNKFGNFWIWPFSIFNISTSLVSPPIAIIFSQFGVNINPPYLWLELKVLIFDIELYFFE